MSMHEEAQLTREYLALIVGGQISNLALQIGQQSGEATPRPLPAALLQKATEVYLEEAATVHHLVVRQVMKWREMGEK